MCIRDRDNVVEISGLILEGQRKEISSKRRHGMGYFGLGSAMAMMKIRYGSPASLHFTRQVTKTLALVGWKQALALSKEKGCAPILNGFTRLTPELKQKYPAISDEQWSEWVGDTEWTVSYTHLDVYKRQSLASRASCLLTTLTG